MTVVKLLVLAARYGIADLLRCECCGIAFPLCTASPTIYCPNVAHGSSKATRSK